MPKIDLSALPVQTGSSYPAPHDAAMAGRSQQRLGDPAGLTQFGANRVHLEPGAMSSLRHWHERQDEFLVVTEGSLTLVDDHGATPLGPGDCCAFPAGDANGHHIVNRSDAPGAFVVIGTRTAQETGWYSDVDLKVSVQDGAMTFTRRDGSAVDLAPEFDFGRFSDALTRALIQNDFATYRQLFSLPHEVAPREGTPYELTDLDALREDFDLYCTVLRINAVTDIYRVCQDRETRSDGSIRVLCDVHVLSHGTRVVAPFQTGFVLDRDPDQAWRVRRVESSLGHINWTRGLASITEDKRFDTD